MWVSYGVRPDLDAARRRCTKGRPVHRRERVGVRGRVLTELRHIERATVSCIACAREDRGRDAELVEQRQDVHDAPVRVVERHVQQAAALLDGSGGGDGPVPAAKQRPELRLELLARDGEPLRLSLDDGVVAEDERRQARSSWNVSSTSASNDGGNVPPSEACSRRKNR